MRVLAAPPRNVLERIEVERAKAERWNGALPTPMYAGAPMAFTSVGKDK